MRLVIRPKFESPITRTSCVISGIFHSKFFNLVCLWVVLRPFWSMFLGEGSLVFGAALVLDAGQVGVLVMAEFGVEVTSVLVMLFRLFCEGGV